MTWQPHITVATVIERDGCYLLVEELKQGTLVLNQPAGHLEANESLREAAIRETLEETGWDVELTALTGIYLYTAPSTGVTYQRVCFAGTAIHHHAERPLDTDITRALWLTREQIIAERARWRSHLLLTCIDDYLAGPVDSLALVRD